jgi:hypothetical protein
MKVTDWPKEDYGKFHEADAYIVLKSHRIHEKTQVLMTARCIILNQSSLNAEPHT